MTDKNISMLEVEEFLIDNLKEIPMGNGKFRIKAECSLADFLEKFENHIKLADSIEKFENHIKLGKRRIKL